MILPLKNLPPQPGKNPEWISLREIDNSWYLVYNEDGVNALISFDSDYGEFSLFNLRTFRDTHFVSSSIAELGRALLALGFKVWATRDKKEALEKAIEIMWKS